MSLIKAWHSDRKGSTSIEFAIVAPMVLMILFFIFEFSFMMLGNSAVQRSASRAAEAIRLDSAASFTVEDIRNAACSGVFMAFACNASSMKITVNPLDVPLPPGTDYQRSTVRGLPDVVRVEMEWPQLLVVSGLALSAANGKRAMVSTLVVHPDPPVTSGTPVTGGLQWNLP